MDDNRLMSSCFGSFRNGPNHISLMRNDIRYPGMYDARRVHVIGDILWLEASCYPPEPKAPQRATANRDIGFV